MNYPSKVIISTLVNKFKRYCEQSIKVEKIPYHLKKLWGNNLWSPSYFARNCGGRIN
ncbi:transposase [Bartonella henselae]|uniref:transposase n=1 Tax=Bartonella henselae TaxID=38323 RepID=UPI0009E49316|nr:hypothetical protein BhenCHDE101_05190 [Bartonella henselae]PNM39396.1 hypothetical protein AL470_004440 [Bartonella henselae str. Houston-1]UAK84983.1 transposase [Bartonella henselae]UJM33665.1 transposase [Bartonella henselae]UJM35117.1 transposase [Bartonella henselae]